MIYNKKNLQIEGRGKKKQKYKKIKVQFTQLYQKKRRNIKDLSI